MKKLAVFVIGLAFVFTVHAQSDAIDPELEAAIGELIDATGALEIGEQFAAAIINQMTGALRESQPDVPTQAFDIISEEVTATITGELEMGNFQALIVPIYAKYFSLEEVRQLLAFYQTPLGRKTVEVMPQLTQESMLVGQSWGLDIGPVIGQRVARRLAEEGIVIDSGDNQ